MSPRIAKTIDVVTREIQLATNNRDEFISASSRPRRLATGTRRSMEPSNGARLWARPGRLSNDSAARLELLRGRQRDVIVSFLSRSGFRGGTFHVVATSTHWRVLADASTASVT